MSATNTQGIYASLKAQSSQKKPFYSVTSNDQSLFRHSEVLSKYINILVESKFHLNLRQVNNEIYYELASLGTQFVQVPWVEDKKIYKVKDESGEMIQKTMTRRSGPGVIPITIEDFFARAYNCDLQKASWVAIRHTMTFSDLKDREAQNIFENVDDVEEFGKEQPTDNVQAIHAREGMDASQGKLYEIYEVYWFIDVDDDGVMEDVRFWIEPDSGVILRQELNELGYRPIVRIPFLHRAKSLYGMGIGQLTAGSQDSCDALFNMALNSTHISSLQMFVTREGSNIGPNEKFHPFKQINSEDPRNDFLPVTFQNTAQPNLMMISVIREWSDRLTGASNAMMGMPDTYAKTRATASGTMFLAQQGSRLFNAISENVNDAYDEIGLMLVLQMIHNKELVDLDLLTEEEKPFMEDILDMDIQDIHLKFNFKVATTEIDQTEEARRQQILTLSQLYSMYGKQTLELIMSQIQLLMQINPQALQPLIEKYVNFSNQFLVGSQHLMEDFFKEFHVERKGLLPYIRDIEVMNELMAAMKDMQIERMFNGQQGQQNSPIQGNIQPPGPSPSGPGVVGA